MTVKIDGEEKLVGTYPLPILLDPATGSSFQEIVTSFPASIGGGMVECRTRRGKDIFGSYTRNSSTYLDVPPGTKIHAGTHVIEGLPRSGK